MEKYYQKLADKYLDGKASGSEAKQVLDWFKTDAGARYLNRKIDSDLEDADRYRNSGGRPNFTWNRIRRTIISRKKRKFDTRPLVILTAAALLLIAVLIHIPQTDIFSGHHSNNIESASYIYSTGGNEQRVLTLTDGTKIHLNSGSVLEIPEHFASNERRVVLKGEAYFDVNHDSQRPFAIEAGGVNVNVLGTSFFVRAKEDRDLIMIAVEEGEVSVVQRESLDKIYLEKDMIGFYDRRNGEFNKDYQPVNNYLSWIHGKISFEKTEFKNVVRQLGHIYEKEHFIHDDELNSLRLTAEFPEQNPDDIAVTIARTLGIDVKIDGDAVHWYADAS